MTLKLDKMIIYFDKTCIMCNSFASFIAKRDFKQKISFDFLQNLNLETQNFDSVILQKNGKNFYKSSAIIYAISALGFPYNLLKFLLIIPQKLRDIIYDFVGKNRYKWFGKKDFCENSAEVKKRLICKNYNQQI